MNIRLAIRWIIRSWHNQVSNTTIYNCFRKSTLVSNPITLPTPILPTGLSELYSEVIRAGNIHDTMAIANFLNPIGENDNETEAIDQEAVLQEVLDEHLGVGNQDEAEEEEFQEHIYTANEAYSAVQVLINYTEHQDGLTTDYLRVLERLETTVKELQEQGKHQSTLDSWVT